MVGIPPSAKLDRVRSRYWQDDDDGAAVTVARAVDLAFGLSGRSLPTDYAAELARAMIEALPWLPDVRGAGVRLAFGAAEGNGWRRDETDGALIYLPKRARLVLRLPPARLDAARALAGRTLAVAGDPLRVGESRVVALAASDTLYARDVVDDTDDECLFLDRIARAIAALGATGRKIMCGRSRRIAAPDGRVRTRSVMVADLAPRDSIALIAQGIGPGRLMGCGLFVPYKRANPPAHGVGG